MWLRALLSLLGLTYVCVRHAEALVVGAIASPHGGIILNPKNFVTNSTAAEDLAWSLHWATIQSGRFLASLEPDLILLLTPHGLADDTNFVLYSNPTAEGSIRVDRVSAARRVKGRKAGLPCTVPPCE